jgi:predicted RNA-binding Zn-ribbon protein involved in translation (DUF1610 family)
MAKTYTASCSCGEKTQTSLEQWNAGFPCPKCGETVKRQSKAGSKLAKRGGTKLTRAKRPMGGKSIVGRKTSLKAGAKRSGLTTGKTEPPATPAVESPPAEPAEDTPAAAPDKPSTAKIVKKAKANTDTMAAVPIGDVKPAVAKPVIAQPVAQAQVLVAAAVPARGPAQTVSPVSGEPSPQPDSKPELPNAPGLPYPLVKGRVVDDEAISPEELRKRQADLDQFDPNTDTGSMTVRIPSVRPRKVLRPATDSMPNPTPSTSTTSVPPATASVPIATPAVSAQDKAELEELRTKVQALEEALEDAQKKSKDYLRDSEVAKDKLSVAESAASGAKAEIAKLEVGMRAAEAAQGLLKEQIDRLQAEIIELTETRTKLQMKVHEGTMKTDAELKTLRLELEKGESRSKVLHAKLQETVKEKVALQQQIRQVTERAEAGAQDRTKLVAEIKRLREQVAQVKQIPQLKKDLVTANAKLAKVVEQYKSVAARAKSQEEVSKDYLRQKMELDAKITQIEANAVDPKELAALQQRADDAETKVELLTEKLAAAHRNAGGGADEEEVERLRIENRILREKLLQ